MSDEIYIGCIGTSDSIFPEWNEDFVSAVVGLIEAYGKSVEQWVDTGAYECDITEGQFFCIQKLKMLGTEYEKEIARFQLEIAVSGDITSVSAGYKAKKKCCFLDFFRCIPIRLINEIENINVLIGIRRRNEFADILLSEIHYHHLPNIL